MNSDIFTKFYIETCKVIIERENIFIHMTLLYFKKDKGNLEIKNKDKNTKTLLFFWPY